MHLRSATPAGGGFPSPGNISAAGGFFDLQINGFAGIDFQPLDLTEADLLRAVTALAAFGTSRIFFTVITDEIDRICRKLEAVEAMCRRNPALATIIAGYHVEGPWLLPEPGFCGMHDTRLMCRPSVRDLDRLIAAGAGRVRLLTLAPELPGSPEVIAHAVARGLQVSAGHTNANETQIDEAIRAGLRLCTHLGNGVPLQLHRHDNVIQRLLARDELTAVFIPDGTHVPGPVLRNFVRAKPPGKVLFTTDCMAAAGAPPGEYHFGHLLVRAGADGVVRQPGQVGGFAGSSLTMDVGCRNVQKFLGWSEAEARAACSTRVAEFFGLAAG